MGVPSDLVKNNPSDKIWWVDDPETVGEFIFTFDQVKYFNLFRDYPKALTAEQKKIFDKENPFWAEYFKGRE